MDTPKQLVAEQPSQIKAKMYCAEVANQVSQKRIKLFPVTNPDHKGENADYAKYTPSGVLELVVNEGTKAYDAFAPGKDYYITITEVAAY